MTRADHLLVIIMEECAEIQQATAKALRFGLDDAAPGQKIRPWTATPGGCSPNTPICPPCVSSKSPRRRSGRRHTKCGPRLRAAGRVAVVIERPVDSRRRAIHVGQ